MRLELSNGERHAPLLASKVASGARTCLSNQPKYIRNILHPWHLVSEATEPTRYLFSTCESVDSLSPHSSSEPSRS